MKPNYTLMQLKKSTTPAEFSRNLREMGDLFWWEPGNFWVITSYELARTVLTSDAYTCDRTPFFLSRMPEMDLSLLNDFFKVVSKMMVMSDAPAHTDRRRICYHGFGNQALQQLKPLITSTISQCLAEFKQGVPFNFVEQLAQVLPSTTLAEFFAIPANERQDFYNWSNNMTQFFGGSTSYLNEDGIKVNHSAKQLYNYFAQLMIERRKNPGTDFLSLLLHYQGEFSLTDDEIISQAIMMLVAGQVTTTDQLCNNLYTLLADPKLWLQVGQHSEELSAYIEECNRLDPAVTFIFRVVKEDTLLGGELIEKGKVIFISTHAANRDPAFFPEPEEVSLKNNQTPHLAYGYGSHFCLGAKLARIEMLQVFQALLQNYPQLKLDTSMPLLRKHHSLSFSGFEQFYLVR